ncbi:ATP-dependent nuclease [Methanococcoides seepicolus]|uniref:AAA family ATPase n=1 Tax=Methanococcoides seepicolus TaxID=2828780 RepID=A0A9E4ZDI1_9EURY|nr:AAA family ATPase [Methanococcoides seepicolus]MCM1986286.1 AAA family ATPase [Methanococcoides seepicolus]
MIKKIKIENFKCFKGEFQLELNEGLNIIVGNNEAGKSTIIEAIHLALTGILNGKYLKNTLTQYLFNNEIIDEYIANLNNNGKSDPPHILIELYFDNESIPTFMGSSNSSRDMNGCGLALKIEFDEEYKEEYEILVKSDTIKTLPIEYYSIKWSTFARKDITTKSIPVKSALIDSSSCGSQNGSDIYLSRIVRQYLDAEEIVQISQAHRNMKEYFMDDPTIQKINEKIKDNINISEKTVELSVEHSSKNSWENSLMAHLDDVPFHYVGKGEQCIIKTKLALLNKKTKDAPVILLEEPENHLTHTKLNQLINDIKNDCQEKQIIISTHSSFVANKLGLDHLILLNNQNQIKLNDLEKSTKQFFEKISGYDTLRMILCKKAILVEGDSDELVVQKAYMDAKEGKLPIEDEIDVISVRSLAFKRFLEIAKIINQPVAVITDNDGDYETKITNKYKKYESIGCISIFADERNALRTLEPQFVEANNTDLSALCTTIGINNIDYDTEEKITEYMSKNKTKWALCVFESNNKLNYPKYIMDAVKWCNE